MRPSIKALLMPLFIAIAGEAYLTWIIFDPWFQYDMNAITTSIMMTWVGIIFIAIVIYKSYRAKTETYEVPKESVMK